MDECFVLVYGTSEKTEIRGKKEVCVDTFIVRKDFSEFVNRYAIATSKRTDLAYIDCTSDYLPREDNEPAGNPSFGGSKRTMTLINAKIEEEFYESYSFNAETDN